MILVDNLFQNLKYDITKILEDASIDYWTSEKGILLRLDMMAEFIVWRTVNNALQIYGSEAGAKYFRWVAELDDRVCPYCESQHDRQFRLGQFMPNLPVHPGCRCFWDVGFEEI